MRSLGLRSLAVIDPCAGRRNQLAVGAHTEIHARILILAVPCAYTRKTGPRTAIDRRNTHKRILYGRPAVVTGQADRSDILDHYESESVVSITKAFAILVAAHHRRTLVTFQQGSYPHHTLLLAEESHSARGRDATRSV